MLLVLEFPCNGYCGHIRIIARFKTITSSPGLIKANIVENKASVAPDITVICDDGSISC